jgi:hypothetical protein
MRFADAALLTLASLAAAGCGNDATPGNTDKTAPAVAITSPAAGAVTGTITIGVTASDASGVATVQWKINGALLATVDSAAPFEYSWNTALNGPGVYAWTAVATDKAGVGAESAPVTYTVSP